MSVYANVLLVADGPVSLRHTPELLVALRQAGPNVTTLMTPSAALFLPPLSLSLLSGGKAKTIAEATEADYAAADCVIVAPASLRTLADMRQPEWRERLGYGKRPVLAAPVLLPAEDAQAAEKELQELTACGVQVLTPEQDMSFGAMGAVRTASVSRCLEAILAAVTPHDLAGLKILLTAGPTIEDADPARYVSNRSTGRMGCALAQMAARRGANVLMVHGPMSVPIPEVPGIECVSVRSALAMHKEVMARANACDVAILCAAVADYRPVQYSHEKIKKGGEVDGRFSLILQRTPDILEAVGALADGERPFLVGFAAESEELERNALEKLAKKNCDMLCANDISEPGAGFAVATNRVTVFCRDGERIDLPLQSKEDIAAAILTIIRKRLPPKHNGKS